LGGRGGPLGLKKKALGTARAKVLLLGTVFF
jgi:hypothetical protein